MGGRDDEPVPAGMPWWCRLLVVAPGTAAVLALLITRGQEPSTVLAWTVVTHWTTGAFARWALVEQGRPKEVARRWVAKGLGSDWLVWPIGAFGVWITVDAVQTATAPAGDWWDWGLVVILGLAWLFIVAVAIGSLADLWRGRAS